LRQALEGQQFHSLEEAQAFVAEHSQKQNRRPLDDFSGLSPEQVHWMLTRPLDAPRLVCFPEVLDQQPSAPVLRAFTLLAEAIGEQGLKPTARGNLPRNFCREAARTYWGEQKYRRYTRYGGINSEVEFSDLHVARLVAQLAGLIRKHKGRFILGRDCRRLLAEDGLAAIYPRLFMSYVEKFNWGYRDGYEELRFVQSAFLFSLYLLTRYGDIWRPHVFYEDKFLRAFPSTLDEVPPRPPLNPEDEVRCCYTWRTLVHFAHFMGLAEVEDVSGEFAGREYRVRALPLLGQFVQFRIPA